jgi:hypothetical protein
MARSVRGFQLNTILDRLALDTLGIFERVLTVAPLDRNRLHIAVLLTLSRKSYVDNLLYRDFRLDRESQWYSWTLPGGGEARVHEQSIVYLEKVLSRRPRLARSLRHEPGNMHLLLWLLCRHGPAEHGWRVTEIRRDLTRAASRDAPAFVDHLALELAAQRARLGEAYSDESRRRREEYGPIWLIRGDCSAELPEEISLFEVLDALPLPLDEAFVEDAEVQRMLVRVMDALNERYMLLRACGLDPEVWHDRDEPSIARLREMKQLRKPAEELLRLGIESDNADAYWRTFDELKGCAKRFAGCSSFDEFATTEHGQAMLRSAPLSLDDRIGGNDEGEERARHETLADPDARDVEEDVTRRLAAGRWVQLLIDDRPDWFDPIMRQFFIEVIGQGRPIHGGSGDHGVLNDPAFQRLVESYPELVVLDEPELVERLCQQAEAIIKRGLRLKVRRGPGMPRRELR